MAETMLHSSISIAANEYIILRGLGGDGLNPVHCNWAPYIPLLSTRRNNCVTDIQFAKACKSCFSSLFPLAL